MRRQLASVFVLGLMAAACSKGPTAAIAAGGDAESACAKDLAPRDVADLLGLSGVSVRASRTNPESCAFDGPGATSVVIGLRAGDEVLPFWKLTLDLNHDVMVPMTGVGDAAMRMPGASEVLVRKGRLSCQVDVIGIDAILARPSIHRDKNALAGKMADVCAKVFAARRA